MFGSNSPSLSFSRKILKTTLSCPGPRLAPTYSIMLPMDKGKKPIKKTHILLEDIYTYTHAFLFILGIPLNKASRPVEIVKAL